MDKDAVKHLESTATSSEEVEYKWLPSCPDDENRKEITQATQGTILSNIRWKEFGILCFVWFAVLLLQIAKNYTTTCSINYWILTLSQIPVTLGVSMYQAIGLYQGKKITVSKQDHGTHWPLHLLILSLSCALLAGILGGLLGVGGGFVMGPLFIELGIAPQVASATATLGMAFTASISVAQYFLLKRFPVPYALYLTLVATIAAYIGQKIIDKLVNIFQRASLIIFVLSFTILISAIALGGVGISHMIEKIQRNEYMGFEDLCY
ncbi:sulfite exporter TauE/SafE family protein [Trifolium repens]|nr:sulfite exporter TauE/SafE family protein [Trifolium repens]